VGLQGLWRVQSRYEDQDAGELPKMLQKPISLNYAM